MQQLTVAETCRWLLAAQLAERVNGIGHVMIPVCRFAGVLTIFGTTTLVLVILWAVSTFIRSDVAVLNSTHAVSLFLLLQLVLPWWTMWIAYFSIGVMVCCVRLRIRTVFMIPVSCNGCLLHRQHASLSLAVPFSVLLLFFRWQGTWWADFGVSVALWCCVLSQMARHVFRYSKTCDTSQPLCPEQIEKVETTQPNRQSAGSAQ